MPGRPVEEKILDMDIGKEIKTLVTKSAKENMGSCAMQVARLFTLNRKAGVVHESPEYIHTDYTDKIISISQFIEKKNSTCKNKKSNFSKRVL